MYFTNFRDQNCWGKMEKWLASQKAEMAKNNLNSDTHICLGAKYTSSLHPLPNDSRSWMGRKKQGRTQGKHNKEDECKRLDEAIAFLNAQPSLPPQDRLSSYAIATSYAILLAQVHRHLWIKAHRLCSNSFGVQKSTIDCVRLTVTHVWQLV